MIDLKAVKQLRLSKIISQIEDTLGNIIYRASRLPSQYQEVSGIISTGTQYIDTGINADSNLSIEITASSNVSIITGAINYTGSGYIRHHFTKNSSSGNLRYYVASTNTELPNTSALISSKHTYFIDVYNKKYKIDNGNFVSMTNFSSFDTGLNYWLFARNSNTSSLIEYAREEINECKIYYEDVLVRHLIPCYRKSDNEIGMYDIVNNVFYTNLGSGNFSIAV